MQDPVNPETCLSFEATKPGGSARFWAWQATNGEYKELDDLEIGAADVVAALSESGTAAAVTKAGGSIQVYPIDLAISRFAKGVRLAGRIGTTKLLSLKTGSDGTGVCVAVSADGDVQLWRWEGPQKDDVSPLTHGATQGVIAKHAGAKTIVHQSSGESFVLGFASGNAFVYKSTTGEGAVIDSEGAPLSTAALSPDGTKVVTVGTQDNTAWVWRLPLWSESDLQSRSGEQILAELTKLTAACLSPKRRAELLGETGEAAAAAFDACERERLVHSPAPSSAPVPFTFSAAPPGKTKH